MSLISIRSDLATLTIDNDTITDFISGDYLTLEPENEASQQTYGAGGAMTISKHIASDVHTLKFSVLRYSDSDILMQNKLNQKEIQVMQGAIKETFDKDGKEMIATYSLLNGTFTTRPTYAHNNEDGSASVEYTIKFRSMTRTM